MHSNELNGMSPEQIAKLEQKYRSQTVPRNPKPNAPSGMFKRIDKSCCSSPRDNDRHNDKNARPSNQKCRDRGHPLRRGSPNDVP